MAGNRTFDRSLQWGELHFGSHFSVSARLLVVMKSRLLQSPVAEEREVESDSPPEDYARRTTDDRTINDIEADLDTLPVEPTPEPVVTATRPSPEVSARPKGRLVVAAILLFCVTTLSYMLWSTFFRDAAYGVVTGKVTAISPPWSGTLTAVYVFAGDKVHQGDVLAIVDDPELQASIDRLGDDLRTAQAELDAQTALLALAARRRGDIAEENRADYYDLRGELSAKQARYDELISKLRRRQALSKRRAVSHEEIESLRFVKQGLAAKIENLKQAVAALETRVETLPEGDLDAAQLKPQLAKIENTQAEIRRLHDQQRRGMLRAPVGGTIIEVAGHVGERATTEQPLLELLPVDSLELVLYISQDETNQYQIGQQAELVVEPASEPIVCQVTRIGQRLEKPLSHVPGRYRPEEKLLPITFTPIGELPEDAKLRIGSTVRLPATLFGP